MSTTAAQSPHPSAIAELKSSWRPMLAVILGMAAMALPGYSLGTFIAPLSRHFGWSVTQVTGWSTAWSAGCILAAPLVGSLADRLGSRTVILISLGLLAAALAIPGLLLESIAELYGVAFVVGMASAGVSSMTYGRIITPVSYTHLTLPTNREV